ncbi:MAG: peptidoglycan-associated lipoprotein Pal [Desulfobulbaceae bacterium]|nr:peptidoglycan-associated lipoprotein Pal [Desulfobulbaceae bacterium]
MSGAGLDGAGVVPGSRTDLGFLPVYFDFDKAIIRPDQVERIAANAHYLKENPAFKVRIEGNCDERGTNEYNLALGERRAMSAMKYLVNLGVADTRVTVLSYGEERPVNLGHDEPAWTENRRGDFVIAQ